MSSISPHFGNYAVLWGGTPILTLTNFNQDWTEYTFTETATDSSTVIAFGAYKPPGRNKLDDISVTESVVHEPASTALAMRRAPDVQGLSRMRA